MGDRAHRAGQMSHAGARCKEPSAVYHLLDSLPFELHESWIPTRIQQVAHVRQAEEITRQDDWILGQ